MSVQKHNLLIERDGVRYAVSVEVRVDEEAIGQYLARKAVRAKVLHKRKPELQRVAKLAGGLASAYVVAECRATPESLKLLNEENAKWKIKT